MGWKEWMRLTKALFASVAFEKMVREHLVALSSASSPVEFARAAGRFGGLRRRLRSGRRLLLTDALLIELHIEPTQHVAGYVMAEAFGVAASTAELDRFATPGRDASQKYMEAARATVARHPETVARYGAMYEWFCKRLDRRIKQLKARL